jgi:DivIVA domain-containing protein
MIWLSATPWVGRVLIVSMEHIAGWLEFVWLGVYALPSLGQLVAARLGGKRFTAVQSSVWFRLLLSPVLVWVGLILLGHDGPRWLGWPMLALCAPALALRDTIPWMVSRKKAGLPWWRFWNAAPSADAGSANPDSPAGNLGPVDVPDAAALIERIRAATFSTTRLRPGYDEEEVDKFLDKLIADLGESGRLDQAEVDRIQFSTTRLRPGYDEKEVDDFLDEVIAQAAG